MTAVGLQSTQGQAEASLVEVRLLGCFVVTAEGRSTGPWPRPSARRLCQLVLTSPGRRLTRDAACEALFPSLSPDAKAHALHKAQSMARTVLGQLGGQARGLLCADRAEIWAATDLILRVDLDAYETALRAALAAAPGQGRDDALVEALSNKGILLEDEPQAEWAVRPRERVEYLRQQARLELARDRSRGVGRACPRDALGAWEACLEADPTDEEAASALMRLHVAQGHRSLAMAIYGGCQAALSGLGLKSSPALEELRATIDCARILVPNGPHRTPPPWLHPGQANSGWSPLSSWSCRPRTAARRPALRSCASSSAPPWPRPSPTRSRSAAPSSRSQGLVCRPSSGHRKRTRTTPTRPAGGATHNGGRGQHASKDRRQPGRHPGGSRAPVR